MLGADKAKLGANALYETSFDLSTNYTASWNFNLLGSGNRKVVNDLKKAGTTVGNTIVTYTSLDPTVATVDDASESKNGRGIVTAVGYGQTEILVEINDGATKRVVQFHVTVVKPYTDGTFTYDEGRKLVFDADKTTAVAYAQVAVGEDFTLALKADGSVWGWGRNDFGQLGTGYGSVGGVESAPVQLTFTKLVGYRKPATLTETEGYAEYYTVAEYDKRLSEVLYPSEKANLESYTAEYDNDVKIVKIAAGMDFAMAIDTEGTLYTWGRNNVGQIGNGEQSIYGLGITEKVWATPTVVELFRVLRDSSDVNKTLAITDIVAGVALNNGKYESYALAVSEYGDLFAWGSGANIQVGEGQASSPAVLTPVKVEAADVVDVSAGVNVTSYALTRTGELNTWSVGNAANLSGRGKDAGLNELMGSDRVVDVDAGYGDIILTTKNGDVWTKGVNSSGQQGLGNAIETTQFTKSSLTNVRSATGGKTTVALKIQSGDAEFAGSGTIFAAGLGESGQLGVDSTYDSNSYVNTHMGDAADDILNLKKATEEERKQAIAGMVDVDTAMGLYQADHAGQARTQAGLTAAIRKDGSVYAWGVNDFGQLGNRIIGTDPLTGESYADQPNYVE